MKNELCPFHHLLQELHLDDHRFQQLQNMWYRLYVETQRSIVTPSQSQCYNTLSFTCNVVEVVETVEIQTTGFFVE